MRQSVTGLASTPEDERGIPAMELQVMAGQVASDMGDDYLGTEHQLLAVTQDGALSNNVLAADLREQAAARCRERLDRKPTT